MSLSVVSLWAEEYKIDAALGPILESYARLSAALSKLEISRSVSECSLGEDKTVTKLAPLTYQILTRRNSERSSPKVDSIGYLSNIQKSLDYVTSLLPLYERAREVFPLYNPDGTKQQLVIHTYDNTMVWVVGHSAQPTTSSGGQLIAHLHPEGISLGVGDGYHVYDFGDVIPYQKEKVDADILRLLSRAP